MNGTNYQLTVWVLVVLICLKIKLTYTPVPQKDGIHLDRYIGWTLDKPNGFLVHLASRVNYIGGNLVKSC